MRKLIVLMFAASLAVVAAVAVVVGSGSRALAGSTQLTPLYFGAFAPIYTDPDRNAGSLVGANALGIADLASPIEAAIQRVVVTNTSASAKLCAYWVAAGAACGSAIDCDGSGTDDGDLVLAGSQRSFTVAGDLRTCLAGSASPTTFHVSRSKSE